MNEVETEKADNLIENNVLHFSKTSGVLSDLANEKFESGDALAAISFCLESEKTGKLSPSLYAKMAYAYADRSLYFESADCWFKYLNLVAERHFVNAYNGLGGAFYLAGHKELAGYYYNMQIQNDFDCELPYDDYMYRLFYEVEGENDDGAPYIKLVDEKKEEQKKLIETAKNTFEKNPQLAENLLSFIPEDSCYYAETCIYRSVAALLASDYELAAEMLEKACSDEKQRQYALNNLFGVYCLCGNEQKAERVFDVIKKENSADFQNLFKFVALLGELKEYKKAYEFSCAALELLPSDYRLYYAHAFCAFNVGKFEESSEYFYKYYSLTGKYYAKYYRELAQKALKGEKTKKKITVSYILPDDEIEKTAKIVNEYFASTPASLKRKTEKVIEAAEAAFATGRFEIQAAACQALAMTGSVKAEKFFKKKLVCFEVPDNIKLMIITLLVQTGNDKLTGAVFSGVYSRLQFERAEFRGEKSSLFLEAYALAFGRLAPICEHELYKIKTTAYDFYYKLCRNGGVKKINDVVALAAAIAVKSKCDAGFDGEQFIEYFSAKPETVNKIFELLNKE